MTPNEIRENDQKLVDHIFYMVLVTTDDPVFCKRPREERMKWVADSLRTVGYDTEPVGSSWGSLAYAEALKLIKNDQESNF